MNKIYSDYAEALRQLGQLENQLSTQRGRLRELRMELEKNKTAGDGSIGLEVSSHAFDNISTRLEGLAMENPVIYNDVFSAESPQSSILWPSNLRAFIITLMAQAFEKSAVVQKQSKNNAGKFEYHYTVAIHKWSAEDNELVFTGVVEGCTIKTGYFNWV